MGKSREMHLSDPAWVVAPIGWGAQVDYDKWDDRWTPKDKLVVHHGGGPNFAGSPHPDGVRSLAQVEDEKRQLRAWEQFHLSKPHRGIDYNYAVGISGTVYRLRGWNVNGAHWGNDDVDGDGASENSEALAVVFILGAGQPMTTHMQESFLRFHDSAAERMGFDRSSLSYHQEVAASGSRYDSTSCPGSDRIEWVKSIREAPAMPGKPSDTVIDYCFDSGLAWGDRNYWKAMDANNQEWWYFNAMIQRGLVGWYAHMGLMDGDPSYWLTLDPKSEEWASFWAAVGETTPLIK